MQEPMFERVTVTYQCNCKYYNDSWESACESDPLCPSHNKPIKDESGTWKNGHRPKKADIHKVQ